MSDYTVSQLKAMAFDVIRQIQLLRNKEIEIIKELKERGAIVTKVDITPDEEEEK